MAVKKLIIAGTADDVIRSIVENFNDLLSKLDADATVTDTNYRSTLEIQDALTNQDI